MINGDYTRVTNYLIERGLDVSLVRDQVIADNIANVDVPNFKRSDVAWEQDMQDALASLEKPPYEANMNNARHISFFQPQDITKVEPNLQVDWTTSQRQDGNNVDIDRESADALRNSLLYRAMADAISENYKLLKLSMRA